MTQLALKTEAPSVTELSKPGTAQLGADIVVESIVREGTDVCFAYPGGASMPIHQALTRYRKFIRTILPRFEQGGGFAAEGYARATGKVGVCIATSGPGATNFATCLADAKLDSLPLVAITGQVPTGVIGSDAFQETPMVELARPITKHHFLIRNTDDAARIMKEAFHIARSGRPGPVLVDIPKDVQNRSVIADYSVAMKLPGYRPEKSITPAQVKQIAAMLAESKKPVIYAGGGVLASGAADALKRFAELTGIPVAMTLQGLGGFPAEHYLSLHMLGMHGTVYSNYTVNEADLLLAWGVRFDDRVTGKLTEFAKHGKIVHIDVDPSELNKNKPAHLPIESDLKVAIDAILDQLKKHPVNLDLREWHHQVDTWKHDEPLKYAQPDDGTIMPQHAIKVCWEIVKRKGLLDKTIVTTGVGQHQMWAAQYWKFNKPNLWATSGGLGSMGFGLPSAMGAQAACPDKLVIDVDGDGSFLMNIQELATVHVEKLPVKVLLLNNQHLGMVVQWEDRFYASNRAHTYLGDGHDQPPYPNFVKLAESFGVAAKTISHLDDLESALEEMIDHDGPYVLDIMVPYQEHVLPMIPAGMTVRDIIK